MGVGWVCVLEMEMGWKAVFPVLRHVSTVVAAAYDASMTSANTTRRIVVKHERSVGDAGVWVRVRV